MQARSAKTSALTGYGSKDNDIARFVLSQRTTPRRTLLDRELNFLRDRIAAES